MSNQNGLTVLGKQHQIPFPVTWLSALVDVGRAPLDGDTPLDVINRATALCVRATRAYFFLGARNDASCSPWCAGSEHR